jgi:hypothetical protein
VRAAILIPSRGTALRGSARRPTYLLWTCVVLVAGLAGCWFPPPPTESPITGVWEFTTTANTPTALQLLLEFDTRGDVVWILYKVGTNATVIDEQPGGSTSVSGSSVSMDLSFGASFFNTFVFTGTIDTSVRQMRGWATLRVRESGTTISLQSVPATLSDATQTPPPEGTVAGTWEYFPGGSGGPETANLEQLLLTFDEAGSPVRVIYKTAGNTTVVDNSPGGSTSVAAGSVTMSVTFRNGSTSFNGVTQSNDQLVGNITVQINDRGTLVDIQNAPANLAPLAE